MVIDNDSTVMATTDIRKLKSGPLRAQVVDVLRHAIISGQYQPGEALREISLAQDLGVSQNTVREALVQLEQTGLVVRTPNKNTTVTRLSPGDIAERVSLRILLEPVVCLAAAERITEAGFEDLQQHLDRLSEGIRANSAFETAQADLAFHRKIWELSECRFLCQVLDQATVPLFAFVSLLRYRRHQTMEEVVMPHQEMFNALRSRDKVQLERIIGEHLRKSYSDFIEPGSQLPGLR